MKETELRDAQQCLQALTFTLVRKYEIPGDKQTINTLLKALGLGIRALEKQIGD